MLFKRVLSESSATFRHRCKLVLLKQAFLMHHFFFLFSFLLFVLIEHFLYNEYLTTINLYKH